MTLYALDGRFLGTQAPALPTTSALVVRGEGWFETVRIEGGRPMFWREHRRRLIDALARTQYLTTDWLPIFDRTYAVLVEALAEKAEADLARARLRILVTPEPTDASRWYCLATVDAYQDVERDIARGVDASIVSLAHPGLGALGKSTSYHWSWFARSQARARGVTEALLARDDRLIEGATASILVQEGDEWRQLGGPDALESVTVGRLCAAGVTVTPGELAIQRLEDVGMVLVSALRLVVPVRSIDGFELENTVQQAQHLRSILLSMHEDRTP